MCKYVKVSLPEGMALRIRDELNISLGIVSHEQPQNTKEQSDSSALPVQHTKATIALLKRSRNYIIYLLRGIDRTVRATKLLDDLKIAQQ